MESPRRSSAAWRRRLAIAREARECSGSSSLLRPYIVVLIPPRRANPDDDLETRLLDGAAPEHHEPPSAFPSTNRRGIRYSRASSRRFVDPLWIQPHSWVRHGLRE